MSQVLPNVKNEDSSQQNNTGKMYSYHDDNNINNPKEFEQGAIRRSLGEGNPYAEYPPQYYQQPYNVNNINNINNNGVEIIQNNVYSNTSNNTFLNWVPFIVFCSIEVILIILIGCCFKWDIRNDPAYSIYDTDNLSDDLDENNENTIISDNIAKATEEEINNYDVLFRDMNIMLFVGFGMFHTLLKRYSWTSITISMMAIAISFQLGLFTNLLWANAFKEKWKKGLLNFRSFIKSIINCCSVLVSFGCVLGKLTNIQYLIMIIFETIICSLNFQLCDVKLKTIDVGGALYIHTFGAIFGLSIYMVLFFSRKTKSKILEDNHNNKSNYFSNITSFIGVIFLLSYFPSFNSGLVFSNNAKYRSSINTYFSLCGSIVGSFITSAVFYKGRFVFEHILFGCFSGGVIISGCCSVCLFHYAALIIGFLCGCISVVLLAKIKPFFVKWKYYDIYNIICIHGIPGLLGAFITPMMIADFNARLNYKKNNENNEDYNYFMIDNYDRHPYTQSGIQIGAIFITLGLSFISGISTGYLMKVSKCGIINNYFTDSEFFEEEANIIDNLEQNQFYFGEFTRASLFQNKIDFPPDRGSQPSYNQE